MNAAELENNLRNFYGTENYYRSSIFSKRIVHTDGVQFLAKEAGAHWLIDLIVSYQPAIARGEVNENDHGKAMLREMQFWTLKRNDEGGATAVCRADSDRAEAIKQEIEYTDFPLDEIKLYVESSYNVEGDRMLVILLPTEH